MKIVTVTASWAPSTRSVIGTATSPKRPIPKVVAQMTALLAMKAPAMANTGGQRAADHNSSGSAAVLGLKAIQDPVGRVMM